MKIKTSLSILLLLFSSIAYTQIITFSDVANLPATRSAICSANDGENIYVGNGFGGHTIVGSEIFKYNTSSGIWTIFTSKSIPKRYASAAVVDQKLYVMYGLLSDGGLNSTVEVIDLKDSTISYTTDNPFPARAAGIAKWDGKIYTFGGSVSRATFSNKLMEFDPIEANWTPLADMPFRAETKGEIVNGKLYVFGGYNGTTLNKMAIYDIATNTWETSLEMPLGVSAHATAIVGDKIYLTGDYTNLKSLIEFETKNNSFKIITETNLIGRRHCASEGLNGRLFVIGGNITSKIQSAISNVQVVAILDGNSIRP